MDRENKLEQKMRGGWGETSRFLFACFLLVSTAFCLSLLTESLAEATHLYTSGVERVARWSEISYVRN